MSEEVLCPQCRGNKFRKVGNTEKQCLYCGTTFKVEEKLPVVKPEEKANTETPPPNWGEPLEFSSYPPAPAPYQRQPDDNSFAKGVAGGVAGGCAGITIAYLAGPIIFLLKSATALIR